MNLSQMIYLKEKKGYSYKELSEQSGVPQGTLQKIFNGQTKQPRRETLKAIEDVLGEDIDLTADYVREAAPKYNAGVGKHTLEDYYALPGERRAELLEGVFYDLAAPSTAHQWFSAELLFHIMAYIKENKGNCIPLAAPVDVQLDRDEYTMLQPDLLVVCDRSKIKKRCVYGAPDFIVEILSQASRKLDCGKKLAKYIEAGVREYWIVDPNREKVVVYPLGWENFPEIYTFGDRIPVRIFDGRLEIDFGEIAGQLQEQ